MLRFWLSICSILIITVFCLSCGDLEEVGGERPEEQAAISKVLRDRWQKGYMTEDIDLYMSDSLNVVKIFGKFIGDRKVLYFDESREEFNKDELLFKRIVIDFLSTLTDNFVFQACSEYFLPKPIV